MAILNIDTAIKGCSASKTNETEGGEMKEANIYGVIRQQRAMERKAELVNFLRRDLLTEWNASLAEERTHMAEQEASDCAALTPCPVCGKHASVVQGPDGWSTRCLVNGCGRRTEGFAERSDAIVAWNALDKEKEAKKPTEKQAASRTVAAKVCGLANKLSKDMPKKEAFAAAWRIAKDGFLEIAIVGVSFGSRQEALKRLASYDPKEIIALLVPEPDCKHDPEAIAVKVMVNGGKGIYTLGYVSRTDTKVVRAFLGRVPEIRLIDGETKGARIRLAA